MANAPTSYSEFNRHTIEDFRANGGKTTSGPHVNSDLLVLHTVGVKSREERLAPLVYTCDGDRLVIVASKGGAPKNPSWFDNLVANPTVTVEAGGETFRAKATVVADRTERDRLYAQHADRYPGFREYEKRTDRVIPVVLLDRIR
jgi:deazaflavin-dependent oxidoreductase (nitroreductase family)